MSTKNNKDLSDLSGEKNIKPVPKYNLPIVQLNGNEGVFYKKVIGEKGVDKVEMGDKITGVMLKIRRAYNSFSKECILSSNEHNSWQDNVTIFKTRMSVEGKPLDTKMFDKGQAKDMKDKHGMKMTQVIYFLLEPDKEIVKLRVRGKGLGNLMEYWKLFKGKDEHVYNYLTEITGYLAGKTPANIDYYATNFQRLEGVEDMDMVATKIREVAGKIQEIDDFYKSRTPEEGKLNKRVEQTKDLKEVEIPVIDIDKDKPKQKSEIGLDEDEIDVKNIPF